MKPPCPPKHGVVVPGAPRAEPPGRFFHTMVLMSTSLALGCGGEAQRSTGTGQGGAGQGGGSTNGDATTRGGTTTVSSGGASPAGSTGGVTSTTVSSTGESGGSGGAAGAGPFDCPSEQLGCESEECVWNSSIEGHRLPADCPCDSARPVTEDDCEEGTSLLCLLAIEDSDGRRFQTPLPFACECVSTEGVCDSMCTSLPSYTYRFCLGSREDILGDPGGFLCGCSVPILR